MKLEEFGRPALWLLVVVMGLSAGCESRQDEREGSAAMYAACVSPEQEQLASEAMDQFTQVYEEFLGDGDYSEPRRFYEAWLAIDVSNTPTDFHVAWTEARHSFSDWRRNKPTRANNESDVEWAQRMLWSQQAFRQKIEILEVVAARYNVGIRYQLSNRAREQRDHNMWRDHFEEMRESNPFRN